MDFLPQLLTLCGIILLACASPGPDFVAVTSHAFNDRRSGVLVGWGIACAVAVWALLAILGFGLLMSQLAWLYDSIRIIGAIYLVYLGIRMLLAARHPTRSGEVEKMAVISGFQAWRRGFLVGITNPKTATFFATLFVTLLPVGAPAWVYALVVLLVTLITAAWLTLLATFFSVGGVRALYQRLRRPVDALMGGVLVALGVRLATDH